MSLQKSLKRFKKLYEKKSKWNENEGRTQPPAEGDSGQIQVKCDLSNASCFFLQSLRTIMKVPLFTIRLDGILL